MYVKELNERTHEEGSDDGTCGKIGTDGLEVCLSQKETDDTGDDTEDVRDDTDVFELALMPGFRDDQGNRIIGGYSHVGGNVE